MRQNNSRKHIYRYIHVCVSTCLLCCDFYPLSCFCYCWLLFFFFLPLFYYTHIIILMIISLYWKHIIIIRGKYQLMDRRKNSKYRPIKTRIGAIEKGSRAENHMCTMIDYSTISSTLQTFFSQNVSPSHGHMHIFRIFVALLFYQKNQNRHNGSLSFFNVTVYSRFLIHSIGSK